MQLGIERGFDIVVVDLALTQQNVLYTKIKQVGRTVAFRLWWRGKVGASVLFDSETHHRVTQNDLIQIDFFM